MTRKTQVAYEHALNYVDKHVFPLSCEAIITDYECAMRQAIRKILPNVKLLGCWFHYAQAIRRKVASLPELFHLVRTQQKFRMIYLKFICLALLPHEKIEKIFHELALEGLKLSEAFTPFVKYFRNQWLNRVGPKNFSVFLEETRTTCAAEGYNGKLGKTFETHPNFFVFVESLQWEELAKSNSLEQHINGARQTQPKKEYRERSDLIRSESMKFNVPNKTNAQLFLNRVANSRNRMLPEDFEKFENIVKYKDEVEEILDFMNTNDAPLSVNSDTEHSEKRQANVQDKSRLVSTKSSIQTSKTTRSKRQQTDENQASNTLTGVKTRSQSKQLQSI